MALQLSRKHILEIDFHSPYSIASAHLEAKEGMPHALLTPDSCHMGCRATHEGRESNISKPRSGRAGLEV